ncbi:MAG: hypothetical protein HOY78_06805 [Saccharothrix sp.]|nr:hypothetical protein [Saccharothrix sp.]
MRMVRRFWPTPAQHGGSDVSAEAPGPVARPPHPPVARRAGWLCLLGENLRGWGGTLRIVVLLVVIFAGFALVAGSSAGAGGLAVVSAFLLVQHRLRVLGRGGGQDGQAPVTVTAEL